MITIDLANNLLSIILAILTILGVFIGIIAWFIRLEAKVEGLQSIRVEEKQTTLEKEKAVWDKMDSFQKTLNDVLVGVGRLEGKLETKG